VCIIIIIIIIIITRIIIIINVIIIIILCCYTAMTTELHTYFFLDLIAYIFNVYGSTVQNFLILSKWILMTP